MRGLAALSVVFLHYATAFAPFLIGYVATQRHSFLDRAASTTPLGLPFAGNFAVCIFFVLSGFVLSIKFFQTKDIMAVRSSAVRRIFRLLPPALISIILGYLALRFGLVYAHQAAAGSESSNWLATFWLFPAHLGQALFQGLYGIWFGNFNVYTSYNPVLWTMHYELYGSFLVFMFLALLGKLNNRWVFYALFGLIFLKTYYLAFIAGMAISDVYVTKPDLKDKINVWLAVAATPIILLLGTWSTSSIYPSIYNRVSVPFFLPSQLEIFMHVVAAILTIVVILRLQQVSNFLEKRPIQYLGRISFGLYLTHFIVMGTLASFIFYRLLPGYGYKLAVVATAAISLPVTIIFADFYTRWVDLPSIALSKKVGDKLLYGNLRLESPKRLLVAISDKIPALGTSVEIEDVPED